MSKVKGTKNVSNDEKLRILAMHKSGYSQTTIGTILGRNQSGISQVLKILRETGNVDVDPMQIAIIEAESVEKELAAFERKFPGVLSRVADGSIRLRISDGVLKLKNF